ncbi:MAG: hypothetical protein JXR88_11930 [Clostridia bacterium]|nr:hypothetical protein [Clostridia bacterium]
MKIVKKVFKAALLIASIAGVLKLLCELCKIDGRAEKYNQKVKFTGKQFTYENEPFEKDSIAASFSGVEVNFEKATMQNKTALLDIFGRFSGIEVKVPDYWHVQMDGVQASSSIENNTIDNSENEEAPLLNIHYDLKFCGLEVANVEPDEVLEETVEEEPDKDMDEDEFDNLEEDLKIEVIEETYE